MPYIGPNRDHIDSAQLQDAGQRCNTPGDLDYAVTRLIESYRSFEGDSFTTFNTIIGVLDNAKDEFRRRVIQPYEDLKRLENGDVYKSVTAS